MKELFIFFDHLQILFKLKLSENSFLGLYMETDDNLSKISLFLFNPNVIKSSEAVRQAIDQC